MKRLLTILATLFCFAASAQTYTIKDTTFLGYNARVAYDASVTDSQECVISFLGAGEVGTDTTKLGLFGPSYWMQHGGWDGVIHLGNGDHRPIWITLQMPNQSTKPPLLLSRVNAIKSRWKIKSGALYMTGYSAGGWQALEFVSYSPVAGDHSYSRMIKAVLGIESVKPANIFDGTSPYPQNMVDYSNAGGRLWAFDQIGDAGRDMGTYTTAMFNAVASSVLYYRTQAGAGNHCCFNTFTDPSQIWLSTNPNISSIVRGAQQNENSLTWLIRQGDTTNGTPVNQPPNAQAGPDINITLPINSVSMAGSGVANGGATIASYAWTKTAGPSTFTIADPTDPHTAVLNLVAGTYTFHLVVTDNNGLTGSDDMQIIVAAAGNTPPTANAGVDQSFQLPTNSTTLVGTASAGTGSITSTVWTQITGSTVTIVSPTSTSTSVTGFAAGVYTFEFAVTNSVALTKRDTMQVTVLSNNTGSELDAYVAVHFGTNPFSSPAPNFWNAYNDSLNSPVSLFLTDGTLSPFVALMAGKLDGRDNGATYGNGQTFATNFPQGTYRHRAFATGGTQTITFTGLNPNSLYTIKVMSSSGGSGTNNVIAWIGSDTAAIVNSVNNFLTPFTWVHKSPVLISGSYQLTVGAVRQTGSAGSNINSFQLIQEGTAANTAPQAFAGQDQVISLPQDTSILAGIGSDVEDSVLTYRWQVITAPFLDSTIIRNPDSAQTVIQHLVQGLYRFRLTVTDSQGATGVDTVNVNVTASTGPVTVTAPKDTTLPYSQVGGHGNDALRDTTQIIVTGSAGPNVSAWRWKKLTGNSVNILSPNSKTTNIIGFTPGVYTFEVMGSNLTDSAKDTLSIRVVDFNRRLELPCRVGAPVTHIYGATSLTSLVKTNIWQTQAAVGDTILPGDTVKFLRNTANGGIYTLFNISGLSGNNGCPVHFRVDTTIDVQGTIRLGNGNDSSVLSYIDADFRVPSKGIKYGMVNSPPSYSASANGVVMNITSNMKLQGVYTHNTGIGMFLKNNADSLHAPQTFNDFRFYSIEIANCFIDSAGAEAIYFGNTSPDGVTGAGGKGPSTRVDSVFFHDNIVRKAGFDGGQFVNTVYLDNYNNWYMYEGRANATSQRYITQMGGNVTGKVHDNWCVNGREGVTGTPYGFCQYYRNVIDSVFTGGTGVGRAYSMTMYGGATGPGSTVVEIRDSFFVWIYANIFSRIDSAAARIHNFQNFNSILNPSRIYNNYAIDPTRTSSLFINSSGSQYIYGNKFFTSFTYTTQDLSTQLTGPLYRVTQGAATQDFTSPPDAYNWLLSRLDPQAPCGCIPGRQGYPTKFIPAP